jgi:hypothetical protein
VRNAGVPFLVLKGPAIGTLAYEDFSLREFGDLDLIVHQQDFTQAKDLLIEQGYQPVRPDLVEDEAQYMKRMGEAHFQKGNVTLDLHWRIAQISETGCVLFLDYPELWERARSLSVQGETFLSFSPEDYVLFLCVHGARHQWSRLSWICDLAELIRRHPNMDWRYILKQSKTLKCRRMLWVGLSVTENLLGLSLPPFIMKARDSDSLSQKAARQVCRRLRLQQEDWSDHPGRFTRLDAFRISTMDTPARQAYFIACLIGRTFRCLALPGEKDQKFLPLPRSLHFLYFFIRPVRIFFQTIQRITGATLREAHRYPRQ